MAPSVIAHLNPALRGIARVETSLLAAQVTLYWVRLEFPGTSLAPIPALAVARLEMPSSLHALEGVLGRDILSQWESFLYEGRRGRFVIRDSRGGLFDCLKR